MTVRCAYCLEEVSATRENHKRGFYYTGIQKYSCWLSSSSPPRARLHTGKVAYEDNITLGPWCFYEAD